jgi:hypothetical protein
MGFTPRINFNTLTTPGGIGQGLQGLVASIDNASVKRAQIAEREKQQAAQQGFQQQGLERLMAQDAANATYRADTLKESKRHNQAMEGNARAVTGLRGLESFGTGLKNGLKMLQGPSEVDRARADMYTSAAEKNRRPVRDPNAISQADRTRRLELLQRDLEDWDSKAMLNPMYRPGEKPWFGEAPPPAGNRAADRTAYEQSRMGFYGLNAAAPTAGGGGDLRAQVQARFPRGIPPEWEMSLQEAEAGDQDSAAQLMEELMGGAAPVAPQVAPQVAPEQEVDLLGNPIQ